MAEPHVTVTEAATPDALPAAARALLGQDAFSTRAWFSATLDAALPPGARAAFQVVAAGPRVLAVLPMWRFGRRLAALATPYTCLWRPLLAPDATASELRAVGRALAPGWRRAGVVRLEAMPADDPAIGAVLDGLRQGRGLRILAFAHFGNWHEDVRGLGWDGYLASRERRLRTALARQTRRARQQPGFAFSLVADARGLDAAEAAYEAVYAASWKQAEPYPEFNPALMRACAAEGSLRLGVLHLDGAPAAAQLWLVQGGWAGVLKLAYDERFKPLAPGNVLTGLMLRHVIETDGVAEIDFGRGDDEYKRLWAGTRRQRWGALVVDPWAARGALEIVRHGVGRVAATWRKRQAVPFWKKGPILRVRENPNFQEKHRKSSFSRKRSKKLLGPLSRLLSGNARQRCQKFLGPFLQKGTACLALLFRVAADPDPKTFDSAVAPLSSRPWIRRGRIPPEARARAASPGPP